MLCQYYERAIGSHLISTFTNLIHTYKEDKKLMSEESNYSSDSLVKNYILINSQNFLSNSKPGVAAAC